MTDMLVRPTTLQPKIKERKPKIQSLSFYLLQFFIKVINPVNYLL